MLVVQEVASVAFAFMDHRVALARHTQLVDTYKRNQMLISSSEILPADLLALKQNHQFIRDDDQDRSLVEVSWEVRMARKYYNKLFKEYALANLSRFKEGKVGLRWRTEKEVVSGKGQFMCGNLECSEINDLHSYEVPFTYIEEGHTKSELVKVRTCPECSRKLFYNKIHNRARVPKRKQESLGRERDPLEPTKRKINNDEVVDFSTATAEDRMPANPPHSQPEDIIQPEERNTFGMESYLKDLFF
jgi:protein FRA10AC1